MSEGVHEKPLIDAPVAKRVDEKTEDIPREERARRSGYRRRFAFVYVGLALVLGLGLGALVVVASDSDDSTKVVAPAWSSYHPDGSTNARAEQIAQHVSERYRLGNGELVDGVVDLDTGPGEENEQDDGCEVCYERAVARPWKLWVEMHAGLIPARATFRASASRRTGPRAPRSGGSPWPASRTRPG